MTGPEQGSESGAAPSQRLDKWLWCARFFKTRTLAARQVAGGTVRVNSVRVTKPAHGVRPGDALTFSQGTRIRVVIVEALADRRGPAPEAQALYEDRSPPAQPRFLEVAPKPLPGGRPTKKDRRTMDQTARFSS